jgi:ethanolamine permease
MAGWNWGLARGGRGGMVIATLQTAILDYALVFSIAELASNIPTAGGWPVRCCSAHKHPQFSR